LRKRVLKGCERVKSGRIFIYWREERGVLLYLGETEGKEKAGG